MNDISLNVAAVQLVSGLDPDVNLERIDSLLSRLLEQHEVELVVLPENALCFDAAGYKTLADNWRHYVSLLAAICKKYGIYLVAGSIPVNQRPDGQAISGRYRSACHVISPQSEVLGRYDKVHLFDVDVGDAQGVYRESDTFEAGEELAVLDIEGFSLGLSICYDLRFPELFTRLVGAGSNIIALPAAFTAKTGEAHWEPLLRARAIETQSYVIAANQGGVHSAKRTTWGHSMIIDPWGRVVSECADSGEGFCVARLSLNDVLETRHNMPLQAHRRL